MPPFTVTGGDGPVILGMPHIGTWLPDDLTARLNETGRALADTDWHIDRLYDGLLPGVTVVASQQRGERAETAVLLPDDALQLEAAAQPDTC